MFEKIYLVGNGRTADDCLRILAKKQVPVSYVEVYAEAFSFTKKLCERLNIPFIHCDKQNMKNFLMGLEGETLIFSVHNSYIFPREAIEKHNLTILNMHIAPLPLYRGMNAPTWEIFDQQEYAGVTWHEVVANIDAGQIIDQKTFPIGPDDTAMKVLQESFRAGVELFEKNLNSFLSKTYPTRPMENRNTRLYLNRELPNGGYLDKTWSLDKVYAFLRSMDYSGANLMRLPRVRHQNKTYEIANYHKCTADKKAETLAFIDNQLIISGGGYSLSCTLREIADTDLDIDFSTPHK